MLKIFKNSQIELSKINYKNIYSFQKMFGHSRMKKFFRLSHPSYWDVDRERTEYLRNQRDYRKIPFNTLDTLHFDHEIHDKSQSGYSFSNLLLDFRESGDLDGQNKNSCSPYRIITFQYNMAKLELYEYLDVFVEMEKLINTHVIDENLLEGRTIYGYLYSAFKFNAYNGENLDFFLDCLECKLLGMRIEWAIELLNILFESEVEDKEHLLEYLLKCPLGYLFKIRFNEFKYRDDYGPRILEILYKSKLVDNKISYLWDLCIKDMKDKQRVLKLDLFDKAFNALNYYYKDPNSPKKDDPELKELIEKMKGQIKDNFNYAYLYNVDQTRRYNIRELIKQSEDINPEEYEIVTIEQEEVYQVKKRIKEKIVADESVVWKQLMEKVNEKKHISTIRQELYKLYEYEQNFIVDKIVNAYSKEQREKLVKQLIKDNKIDSLFEKPAEAKPDENASAPAGGAKGADAGGDVKGKKDKKKK